MHGGGVSEKGKVIDLAGILSMRNHLIVNAQELLHIISKIKMF